MATGGWASLVRPFRRMEIPPKLKEYLDNNRCVYRDSSPIADLDEPLEIDSLGLIRLIAFLDNEFGYRIEDEEMTADNFATLRQLGQLLATKTPTGAGPMLGPPLTRFPEPTGAPSQPK